MSISSRQQVKISHPGSLYPSGNLAFPSSGFSTYSVAVATTTFVKTATTPATDSSVGRAALTPSDGCTGIQIIGLGTGSDNQTFTTWIVGWRKWANLWLPFPICSFAFTLSALVGDDDTLITASHRRADTIGAITRYDSSNLTIEEYDYSGTAADKFDAMLWIKDIAGFPLIELRGTLNGGTASSFNWGYAFV